MPSKPNCGLRLSRQNVAYAKAAWPTESSKTTLTVLRQLSIRFGFSAALGEIRILDGGLYVTHSGLLRLAERRKCRGILVEPVPEFSDTSIGRWVFKATVYKLRNSQGFVGFGDADSSNVSSVIHGAEMRVAETRAVSRALRKAYGIGLCSVEELGTTRSSGRPTTNHHEASSNGINGHHNGQPRLRDRLCLLIRQHQLDATLVKAFAADYCGTPVLRDASRKAVEAFINDLAERAAKDRDGLLSHLNTYAKTTEVSQ